LESGRAVGSSDPTRQALHSQTLGFPSCESKLRMLKGAGWQECRWARSGGSERRLSASLLLSWYRFLLSILILALLAVTGAQPIFNASDPLACDAVHPAAVVSTNDNPSLLRAGGLQQADAGGQYTVVLVDGLVKAGGLNDHGQLGISETAPIHSSTVSQLQIVPLPELASLVCAGYAHACALLTPSRDVMCWGRCSEGQCGLASTQDVRVPKERVKIGGPVKKVFCGGLHTVVLFDNGTAKAFGENSNGQLGYPSRERIGDDEHPETAPFIDVGGGLRIVDIVASDYATAFILNNGRVRAVGRNDDQQLGYGNQYQTTSPAAAGDLPNTLPVRFLACAAFFCMGAFAPFNAPVRISDLRAWGQGLPGDAFFGTTITEIVLGNERDDIVLDLFAKGRRFCVVLAKEGDPIDQRAFCGAALSLPYDANYNSLEQAVDAGKLRIYKGPEIGAGGAGELGTGIVGTAVTSSDFWGFYYVVLPVAPRTVFTFGEYHAVQVTSKGVLGTAGGNGYGQALHDPQNPFSSGTDTVSSFQPDLEPFWKLGFPAHSSSSILQISTGGKFTCALAQQLSADDNGSSPLVQALEDVRKAGGVPSFRDKPLLSPSDNTTLIKYKTRLQVQCLGSSNDGRLGYSVSSVAMGIPPTTYRLIGGGDQEAWHQLRPIDDAPGNNELISANVVRALKVVTGETFACALFEIETTTLTDPNTTVSCWGQSRFKQQAGTRAAFSGAGTDDDPITLPSSDTGLPLLFQQGVGGSTSSDFGTLQIVDLVAGGSHACIVHIGATRGEGGSFSSSQQRYVRCWGSNTRLQAGMPASSFYPYGVPAHVAVDLPLPDVPALDPNTGISTGQTRPFQPWQVALGGNTETNLASANDGHTCVLDISGYHLVCFGDNTKGQAGAQIVLPLGSSTMSIAASRTLRLVPLPGQTALAKPRVRRLLAAGASTCLVLDDPAAKVYCFGSWAVSESSAEKEHVLHVDFGGANGTAPVASNPNTWNLKPVPVPDGWITVDASLSVSHLCLLSQQGKVRCVGRTSYGRCGFAADQRTGPNWIVDARAVSDISLSPGPSAVVSLMKGGGNGARHTCLLGASLATTDVRKLSSTYLSSSSAGYYYSPLLDPSSNSNPSYSVYPFVVPPVVPDGIGYLCWGRQLSSETGRVDRERLVDGVGQTEPPNFGVSHLQDWAVRNNLTTRPAGRLPICFAKPAEGNYGSVSSSSSTGLNITRCCTWEFTEGQTSISIEGKNITAVAGDAFVDRADWPGREVHISTLTIKDSVISPSALLTLARQVALADGSETGIPPVASFGVNTSLSEINTRIAALRVRNVTISDGLPSAASRDDSAAAEKFIMSSIAAVRSDVSTATTSWLAGPKGIRTMELETVRMGPAGASSPPSVISSSSAGIIPSLLLMTTPGASLSMQDTVVPAIPPPLREMLVAASSLVTGKENDTSAIVVSQLSLESVVISDDSLVLLASPLGYASPLSANNSSTVAAGLLSLSNVTTKVDDTTAISTSSPVIRRRGIASIRVSDSRLHSSALVELLSRTANGSASLSLFRSVIEGSVPPVLPPWALSEVSMVYSDLRLASPVVYCSLLNNLALKANITLADYLYNPRLPSFGAAAGACSQAQSGSIGKVTVSGLALAESSNNSTAGAPSFLDYLCSVLYTDGAIVTLHGSRWPSTMDAFVTACGPKMTELAILAPVAGPLVTGAQVADKPITRALIDQVKRLNSAEEAVSFALRSALDVSLVANAALFEGTSQDGIDNSTLLRSFPDDVSLFGRFSRLKRLALRRLPRDLRLSLSSDHLLSLPDALDSANIERLPGGVCRPGQVRRSLFGVSTAASEFVSTCDACPRGYFCPNGVGSSPCPPGTYNDEVGGSSDQSCLRCPAGTFNTAFGQGRSSCISCPAGYFSEKDGGYSSETCKPCQPGSYSSVPGSSFCRLCEESSYSSTPAATFCSPCPSGKASPEGTRSILGCRTQRENYVDDLLAATVAKEVLLPSLLRRSSINNSSRMLANAGAASDDALVIVSASDGVCAPNERPVIPTGPSSLSAVALCVSCPSSTGNSSVDAVSLCSGLSGSPSPSDSLTRLILSSFIRGNDKTQLKQPGNVFVPATTTSNLVSNSGGSAGGSSSSVNAALSSSSSSSAQFGSSSLASSAASASAIGATVAATLVGLGAIPAVLLALVNLRSASSAGSSTPPHGSSSRFASCCRKRSPIGDASASYPRPESSRFEGTNSLATASGKDWGQHINEANRNNSRGGPCSSWAAFTDKGRGLVRKGLLRLDFFGLAHQPPNGEPLKRQDSAVGGAMTVWGIFTVVGLCSALLVQYSLDNRQTSTLFPLRSIYTGWDRVPAVTTSGSSSAASEQDQGSSSGNNLATSILRLTFTTNTNGTGQCVPLFVSGLSTTGAPTEADVVALEAHLLQIPPLASTPSSSSGVTTPPASSSFACAYQLDASGLLTQQNPASSLQVGAHWSAQSLGVGISTVSAISHASYGYLSGINQRSPLSTLLLYVLPKTSSSEALAFATEARTLTAAATASAYLLEATVSATLAVDVLQNDMVIAAPATAATTTSASDSSNGAGGSGSSSSSTPPGTSSKGGTLTRGFKIAGLSMTPRYRDRSEGVSLGSDMVVLTVNLALEANAVYEIWSEKLTPVQLLAGLLSFASVLGAMRLATSFLTKSAVIGKRVGSIRVAVSNRIRSRNSSRKSPALASVTEAATSIQQSESPRPLLLSPSSVDASSPSPKLFAVVDGGRQQEKEVSSRGSLPAVTAASPSAKALGLGGNIANASRRVMMAPSGPQSRASLAPLPLSPGERSLPALPSSSLAPQAVMVNPLHHHHTNSLHLNSNGSSNGNGRGSVDAAADDEGNGEDKW
jgi:alpha-tubulin suppressor-like RCC1 family protein